MIKHFVRLSDKLHHRSSHIRYQHKVLVHVHNYLRSSTTPGTALPTSPSTSQCSPPLPPQTRYQTSRAMW